MKKILVSGCANCPYLTVWNDGDGEKEPLDRICSGDCRHPSFHKELGFPHFNREVFCRTRNFRRATQRCDRSTLREPPTGVRFLKKIVVILNSEYYGKQTNRKLAHR